jgi:hypothetical protein
VRRCQQGREGILQSVDAPCVRIGKEPRTAEAATAVDMRTSTCARKNLQRQTQASIKAAGFFRYENGRHEIGLRNSIRKKGRTLGEGEGRCQAIVLVLLVGLRCLSGRSRRIRKNPGGVWFAPKPSGGGAAVVFLESEDPERALRELVAELAAPETSFDSWLRRKMHELFGCDFAQLPRPARDELLFAWREAAVEEGKEEPS